MAKTLASKTHTPWNAYTHLRASRIGLGGCRTVGEWPTRFHWRASQVVTGEVACAPPAPLSILHGPSWAFPGQNAVTLFLMGGGPGGPECGRGDGDAARMADDRVLPSLIADETGAAGTAEQSCQGYAREFCHSWFHNIIPAFRPAGRWNDHGDPIAHRAFQPIKWVDTDSRESRLPPTPLVTAQQCR